jgi:DNA-binding NarL/FixJ family response regulator
LAELVSRRFAVVAVVVVAHRSVHARLVAHALDGKQELKVSGTSTGSRLRRALAGLPRSALAGAAVVVFAPAEPVDLREEGNAGREHRPPLVIYDVEGRVDVVTAMELGARGYVGYWEPEALVERVLQLAQGELALPPDAAAQLERTLQRTLHTIASASPGIRGLTEEETEIML